MSFPGDSDREYTIAVIFAMEVELNAFRFMLDEVYHDRPPRRPGDPNRYFFGRMRYHNVVLARPPEKQGTGAAATVVSHLSRTFPSIKWRLLVGVGGGVPGPQHDIQLGDVVVSMPTPSDTHGGVVQYNLGRDDERSFRRKGFLHQPPSYLVSTVAEMKANHMEGSWRVKNNILYLLKKSEEIRNTYQQPDRQTDILFPEDTPHVTGMTDCDRCDTKTIQERPKRSLNNPKIHYGLIASGDEVVVSVRKRKEFMQRVGGDVLCFEMEAAGIATEYPCLVIRGISDYADQHKTKGWQPYASATAAACAKELIELIEPERVETSVNGHSSSRDGSARGTKRRRSSESPDRYRDLRYKATESLQFDGCDARARDVSMEFHGTCEWLFQSEIWERWYQPGTHNDSPASRLLCMRGKPGAGKSTLMKVALEHVQKKAGGRNLVVVSHFFNARGSRLEKSVSGLYRSLLCQLLKRLSVADVESLSMPTNFEEEYQWRVNELANLLRATVQKLHVRQSSIVCFVDALDECEGDVNGMVEVFRNLMAATPRLRVCFACRHYPSLPIDEARINSFTLEEQSGHHQDLRIYIDSHLTTEPLRDAQIQSDVFEKVDGIFMYCTLVVSLISDEGRAGRVNTRQDVQELLDQLPNDLHALFQDILTRQSLSTRGRQETMLCLQWVLFFLRNAHDEIRLTPVFLWWAVQRGLQQQDGSRKELHLSSVDVAKRYILNISRGLLEVTYSGLVRVIHESVREFFCKDRGLLALTTPDQPHATDAHDVIALSHKQLQDICWDTVFSSHGRNARWLSSCSEKHFQVYAVGSLLRHAEAAQKQHSRHVSQASLLQSLQNNVNRTLLCQRYNSTKNSFMWTRGSSRPLSLPEHASLQSILCWQDLPELLAELYFLETPSWTAACFGLAKAPSQAIQYHQTFDDTLEVDWANVEWPWATPIEAAIRMNNWATLMMLVNIHLHRVSEGRLVSDSRHKLLRSLAKTIELGIEDSGNSQAEALWRITDTADMSLDDIFAASPVVLLERATVVLGPYLSIFFLIANLSQHYGDPDRIIADWNFMPTISLHEAIAYLLERGVCPFGALTWSLDKTDMLLWAITKHHHEVASSLILVYGVQNCVDRFGRTPLHVAAQWGNDIILAQLLPLYSEEPQDRIGETPIMKAASRGHLGSFELLRDWPLTQLGRRDHEGGSIWDHAVEGCNNEVMEWLLASR
ncbi:phosphorylase superfamily protein [Sarocladium implicatum]|nr:phosphorylase superfamily protein [Sarocladium implicatum]